MKRGGAGPPRADGVLPAVTESSAFHAEKSSSWDLLVSRGSELRETALVLIILKGSFGTPVTLVVRAESAIFPLPGGREREFISERKIYKQIFYIYIFNFLLKNTFQYCLAF